MKHKTLKIIILILIISLLISLHFDIKDEIHLDCEDLGMATIFVSVDTVDILKTIEEEYGLSKVRKPAGTLSIENLEIKDLPKISNIDRCNITLCGDEKCLLRIKQR